MQEIIESIQSGAITEGQAVDFKSRVDLKEERSKTLLIQAVVAFLNANAAHVYVGVREGKDHRFERFEPYDGDFDERRRQLQSILLDGIDPSPIGVVVDHIEVDDGYILDINIPELRMRPYQAKATGAFHVRTGAQNTPLPRDKVRAMFTTFAEYQAVADMLMAREDAVVASRDSSMPSHAVTLHIAIVPGEHFERDRTGFDGSDGPMRPTVWRQWHGATQVFSGCQDGFEVVQHDDDGNPICRVFVGNDWLVHSLVAFPFVYRHERVTVSEFKEKLAAHLDQIDSLFEKHGIRGPFALAIKVQGLQRDKKVSWLFPNTQSKSMKPSKWVQRVGDPEISEAFYRMVVTGSRYGGY